MIDLHLDSVDEQESMVQVLHNPRLHSLLPGCQCLRDEIEIDIEDVELDQQKETRSH